MQGSSSKFMSWHGHNFIEEDSLAGVYKSGRWNKNSEASSPLRLVKRAERDTDADLEITWRDLNSTRVQHTSLASEFTASTTTPVKTKKSNLNRYPPKRWLLILTRPCKAVTDLRVADMLRQLSNALCVKADFQCNTVQEGGGSKAVCLRVKD